MIPSSKIYDYILDLADRKINLFYFNSWQSRNLDSCQLYVHRTKKQRKYWPVVISHDQEMLNWDRYTDDLLSGQRAYDEIQHLAFVKNLNLRWVNWNNVHDSYLITHSEKSSEQLSKYKQHGWATAYFWSHAILALDWYRYAKSDPLLEKVGKRHHRDFLIYSRGWQGTREYRLKFAEKLYEHKLDHCSVHMMSSIENSIPMSEYSIKDQRFQVNDLSALSKKIPPCLVGGDASANYHAQDFIETAISVVLETNFSNSTQHLTEKILRPIAVGHPFILVSSPGCLQYLRDYGFCTFDPLINERYDVESDPLLRQDMIINEMLRLSNLPFDEKKDLYAELNQIALKNRRWFFSNDFYDLVTQEMKTNIKDGIGQCQRSTKSKLWLENIKHRKKQMGVNYHRQVRMMTPNAAWISRLYRKRLRYGG